MRRFCAGSRPLHTELARGGQPRDRPAADCNGLLGDPNRLLNCSRRNLGHEDAEDAEGSGECHDGDREQEAGRRETRVTHRGGHRFGLHPPDGRAPAGRGSARSF
ncbi:hypothetical protein ACFPRL_32680 [Pseudoclavibacter helvolus]